jgi:hypothetical protein
MVVWHNAVDRLFVVFLIGVCEMIDLYTSYNHPFGCGAIHKSLDFADHHDGLNIDHVLYYLLFFTGITVG